ncbi:HET-domain-containing protein, partial [Hyaloscypha variabilis F]
NFDLARDWFSYCRKSHGHECERDPLPQNYQDSYALTFRLIDVSRDCVCDAEASWSYVALSYVWGQAPMLKLVQANKVELYSSGALASDKQAIPQTIRDAILVVKRLGEQYLWVDALCITQDDNVEKAKVIGEMDLIYSRANLTIVAAFGNDASAGLPGLQSGTRMVDLFEARMTFNSHGTSKQLTVARSRPTRIIDDSKWNSRGWTYQEKLFSHRMLLFTEEQVLYW